MRPTCTTLAAVGTCFAGLAHSYKIHEGCGGDTQFVRDMVEQALGMANLASAAVKTTPIHPDANFLGQQMFQMQDGELKALIERGFDPQGATADGVTPGILSFQREQTGAVDTLGVSDVVIFCTTDRLTRMPDANPPAMFDAVAQRSIEGTDDGCGGVDFMWTYTFDNHWDEIQICPWFLQYAKAKKNKTIKDISSKRAFLAVAGLDKLITYAKLTPIDLMSLWDKAMLHEFMHTKAGGCKIDVGDRPWQTAYGWKNAKARAADNRAIINCDNYALFGSAYYYASQGSPVDADGKFTARPVQPNSKRWLGSGAGMAWDAMKLEAVKQFT